MKVLTYEIELLEPCLVTALEGDPNSAVAFNYLPGAVLRGAIIDRYIRQRKQQDKSYRLNATASEEQLLFFDGRTRFLNAYPLANSQRTLPVSLAWHVEKSPETDKDAKTIYDFAIDDTTDKEWQPCSFPFTLLQGDIAYEIRPQRHIAIHIARDRRPDRNKEREPEREVYRYDALAAGQHFSAAILCQDKGTAQKFTQLLPQIIALGGSRSGGYGRVAIHNIQTHDSWREMPGSLQPQANTLAITLLSDALIRDKNGQFVVNGLALTQALATQLGCSLTLQRAYYQATTVGGFNRKWGLPLPQTPALKMGSAFIFTAPDCAIEQLRALETAGIGERRLEGFGRLAVNGYREDRLEKRELPEVVLPAVTLLPKSSAGTVAQDLANRLLRQKLDALLDEKANNLGRSVRGMKKSQLYALRQAFQSALLQEPEAGRQALTTYLQHALKRRVSREQLEKARVEGQKLSDWLAKRMADETEIWRSDTYLKVDPLPQIGGIKPDITPELAYEYNLRLVAAVLSRAARANGQGGHNE